MRFQKVGMRIGPTGMLKVGTMMTIGGMTNGWRAVMVNGEFCRLGGTIVLDGIVTASGYTWQQEPVQSAELSASHDNRSDVRKAGSVGSMIINPLLYDLTCETTGGLRFVIYPAGSVFQATVELTIKVKNKFTFSNAENIQWIHLTTGVKFSQVTVECMLLGFPHTL